MNNDRNIHGNQEDLSHMEDHEDLARHYYWAHGESSGESSNDSSSDDDIENLEEEENAPENNPPSVVERLREWGRRISQKDLDELLEILREVIPILPKSSKTFLRTSDARYNIIEMDDAKGNKGQFVYFNIQKYLEKCINPAIHSDNLIQLTVSCDGVPLSKSGYKEFWVMSGKVHFNPDIYPVFPICIFFGEGKPNSVAEYLEEFIQEVNQLNMNGFIVEGKHFNMKLKCIIGDTPARAFLKRTLGHTGKEACERCEVVGEKIDRTTVYSSTEAVERTDESFRNFRQPEHHHGPSPLFKIIPFINMILIFVLDAMHLFFCGIMKKLLDYWLNGNLNCRLNITRRIELGRRLEYIKSQIPVEFQRKTRSTSFFAKWKATEFRFFLLYCGPIILKDLLPTSLYEHFLLLHVGARILHSDSFCRVYNGHAKIYLRSFFTAMRGCYGDKSQILNAHHLIHVADDVESMDCNLSRINAFPFENFLGQLKKKLRTPNRTLAQVCRRIHEEELSILKKKIVILPPIYSLKIDKQNNIIQVKYKEFVISSSPPDNIVILNNDKIVKINRIFRDEILKIECQVWKKDKPLYTYPTNSEIFNIWKLNNASTRNNVVYPLTAISQKLVKLQLSFGNDRPEKVYVVPLLH